MHKRFLIVGLGLLAALAGSTTTQPKPVNLTQRVQELASQEPAIEQALVKPAKQTPARPAARAAAPQQKATLPMGLALAQPYFREQSQRRRVKRGRSSWVVLG